MSEGEPDVERVANERLQRALEFGSDISGATFGAAAGFLMGGPVGAGAGAAAGSFLGHSLRAAGAELFKRYLSPREEKRVGAIVIAAAAAMQERLARGERPRDDGFFDSQPDDRSSAEEVAEGLLVAAQREHEEKKIPFMGRLLSNIAFDNRIDRPQANFLIAKASALSYRAFCIIYIAAKADALKLRGKDYRGERRFSPDLLSLLTETLSLYRQALVQHRGGETVLGPTDVWPSRLRPIGVGAELYNLMELRRLRERPEDLLPIARLLGSPASER